MKQFIPAQKRLFLAFSCLLVLPAIAFLSVPTAKAVPSFARQLGVDCSQCHIQAFGPVGKLGSWLTPWANARFSLQYVIYNKFNGRNSNYDGSGRNADDNNTLFLLAWFLF